MNNLNLLYEGLGRYGIAIPLHLKSSNGFIRWGKKSKYWAKEIGEGYIFGDFSLGVSDYIFPNRRKLTLSEKRKIKQTNYKIKDEQRKVQGEAVKKAYELWETLPKADNTHPYLIKKQIDVGANVKLHNSQLVIPLVNIFGELSTLQFIDKSGNKRFFPGGKKKGCFYVLGDLSKAETIYLCEGYATGMSLNKILSPVVVCFDAGNLKQVAIDIRRKYPDTPIVICADNDDCSNEIYTGLQKAYKAALAINNARVIYPQLIDENNAIINDSVDFNDIGQIHGSKSGFSRKKIDLAVEHALKESKDEIKKGEVMVKFYSKQAEKIKQEKTTIHPENNAEPQKLSAFANKIVKSLKAETKKSQNAVSASSNISHIGDTI